MELKGSKTEQNLKHALAGESIANTKYTFYAAQAKKDGYEQIADIFEETAENEKEHAEIWFKFLHDGKIPSTKENLQDAINGENYEWTDMYDEYANIANEEGFTNIANKFTGVGQIEKNHEIRFKKLLQNIDENMVFDNPTVTAWICLNCGHIHIGKEAPKICPVCSHSQAFFERKQNNY